MCKPENAGPQLSIRIKSIIILNSKVYNMRLIYVLGFIIRETLRLKLSVIIVTKLFLLKSESQIVNSNQ